MPWMGGSLCLSADRVYGMQTYGVQLQTCTQGGPMAGVLHCWIASAHLLHAMGLLAAGPLRA